jgi:hypothetical protein
MSEPITDIFLSELPYIMKLDPWAGSRVGETLVNVTAVNVYATHEVDCHFGNTSVEARWDEYSKTAACISPPAGLGDVFTGDVDFEVHLRGDTDDDTRGLRITNTISFSYYDREVVYRLSPAFGPRTGGTMVTVKGANIFGMGTVNEMYCVFNSIRSLASYVDANTATCASPPEETYNRALRATAQDTKYKLVQSLTDDSYGVPDPINGTTAYRGNDLAFDVYKMRNLYGLGGGDAALLDEGDFHGEMNGPIFLQTLASRVMALMAEAMVDGHNITGVGVGLARAVHFEGQAPQQSLTDDNATEPWNATEVRLVQRRSERFARARAASSRPLSFVRCRRYLRLHTWGPTVERRSTA